MSKIGEVYYQDMAKPVEDFQERLPCIVDTGATRDGRRRRLRKQQRISVDFTTSEFENKSFDSEGSMDVLCPNIDSGCEWSGSLSDLTDHTNTCLHKSSYNTSETVVAPMIVMMSEFEQIRMNNEQWYSPVFCTHERGYQFRLRVDANGWCSGDAVAVVVSLVKGDHDDELEWPFQGTITVQILNHIRNSSHSTVKEFIFKNGGYECQPVIDETEPEFGCWCDRFITHSALQYDPVKNSQYLKDDCLLFSVDYKPLL